MILMLQGLFGGKFSFFEIFRPGQAWMGMGRAGWGLVGLGGLAVDRAGRDLAALGFT